VARGLSTARPSWSFFVLPSFGNLPPLLYRNSLNI